VSKNDMPGLEGLLNCTAALSETWKLVSGIHLEVLPLATVHISVTCLELVKGYIELLLKRTSAGS
jgi:hypothetical protein